ncbi:type VI immunity family protein [Rhodovulum sulfidophilum]|uniref:type VI immunity family protein n=1 Tax=Rhodovulum sulfidophilum TaxID=35806 RepID=UPI0019230D2F|nr:type VI immunity family protein [Rhodovulum sulfidophilum]MBL3561858.1 DUF3396 domain-containing protein [Rhodovulum sulfidophilum]
MEKDLTKLDELILLDARRQRHQVLRFGFQLHLSYPNGMERALREAAVDVAHGYWNDTRPVVDAFQRSGASRYSPIRDGAFESYFRKRLAKKDLSDSDKCLILIDSSDGRPPAQHQFMLRIGAQEDAEVWAEKLRRSNLTASWPVARCVERADDLIALILDWCNRLHPEQGTAGIAPIAEHGMLRHEFREYTPFIKRFPGLDFAMPGFEAPLWGGIRTVNWLTILGHRYVEALGGCEALAGMLDPQVTAYDYDGGILLRAGLLPELGDVNHGLRPELYRHVDAIVRPLRFVDYPNTPMALIKVPEPMDAYQETLAWVRRFERS